MKHSILLSAVGLSLAAGLLAGCVAPQVSQGTLTGDVLIRNVETVSFEGPEPVILQDQFILIEDGRITHVSDNAEGLSAPIVIDGAGQTLIPGLTDMHVHVWDKAELGAYLAHGVTTVRNMSGMPFHLQMADRIESGELTGPRLLTTGPILNSPGPNQQINHQIVETAEEARDAVHWQYEQGFRDLKLYSNLSSEAYQAIREEAEALGMSITGHTPEGHRYTGVPLDRDFDISFDSLLEDRFLTIEHTESIVWHGLRGLHDDDAAQHLADDIATSGIPVTPTLLAHHNLYRVASEGEAVLTRTGTEWLNPFVQAMEADVHARWLSERPEPVLRNDLFYQQMTGYLHEAGVTLVAGSDAGIFTNIPGVSLLEELELLTESGLSPYEAIQTATVNTANVLQEPDRACLHDGCIADLVLYACNPVKDLACIRSPETVIRSGQVFDRTALDTLLETAAQTDAARSETNLMSGLAEQTLQ
ncbi:amidohydrolase family protein [Ponticaulis sp.]|uniref:amidohydrolase family protein n=1 Tax=Ponticaulis sp. TaxID=2020902 RepID=UPI00262CFF93|nr:amidohydrolase family protein [Ponticaulis sp.]MDF1679995.1 amidohydrolase family protein [Ponticaulis sp.]